jgi:ADP-heptose:LPS heptosyltransferase
MKKRIYIETYGGLGDIALLTPVFQELRLLWPQAKIIALCSKPDHLKVLENNPHIDVLKVLKMRHRVYYKICSRIGLMKVHSVKYAGLRPSFSYSIRASEVIAEMVGITLRDANVQISLTEEEDVYAKKTLQPYANPFIIHITSVATKNQMWPIEKWNELVASMPGYTFIQLGLPNEEKVAGAVDLRGKTSIRESMALVKHAKGFVGVVSFLAHVTNAFNTPGVVFFGPSTLAVWGHPNNINISKNLPCSGCVDWLKWTACPYGKPCMHLITVKEVQEAIEKQAPVHAGNLQPGGYCLSSQALQS